MSHIPPVVISHGSPMPRLEPGRAGAAWQALALDAFAIDANAA
jgi:aromatic ring-opening dioxygenase catalytic subunit (LigB family)